MKSTANDLNATVVRYQGMSSDVLSFVSFVLFCDEEKASFSHCSHCTLQIMIIKYESNQPKHNRVNRNLSRVECRVDQITIRS